MGGKEEEKKGDDVGYQEEEELSPWFPSREDADMA